MNTDLAVPATGRDAGVCWHYGDPLREQRLLATGAGVIDRSNRDVLAVPGADRLRPVAPNRAPPPAARSRRARRGPARLAAHDLLAAHVVAVRRRRHRGARPVASRARRAALAGHR